ncbi:MAG: CoA transferase [Phycisphaerales bacterium]|nr:CoA transferase [Phycisphaerales bacterium]
MEDRTPPLTGITVIDLGRVLAAPFASSVLASLGARVIKVERPGTGDDARHFGPFVDGRSLYFASVNCDKDSIALDLKSPHDRATFDGLLEIADVLVENFSPGVMDSLGFGWTAVHERWPRLIQASVSGFGQTGPLAKRPSYDIIAQALSGMMSLTGHADGPPVRVGASIGDLVAGLYLALGVVSALHKRARTGVGDFIDVSMLDSQVAFLEAAVTTYTATGVDPKPRGTRHPSIAPFQAFRCADRWLVIAAGNDDLFSRLAQTLGRNDLPLDPRFATNAARHASVEALEETMTLTLGTRPAAHWIELLGSAKVPCAPIQTISEMTRMEQIVARDMIIPILDPRLGGARVPGNPIKMASVEPPLARRAPPDLDEHRESILAEIANASTISNIEVEAHRRPKS